MPLLGFDIETANIITLARGENLDDHARSRARIARVFVTHAARGSLDCREEWIEFRYALARSRRGRYANGCARRDEVVRPDVSVL